MRKPLGFTVSVGLLGLLISATRAQSPDPRGPGEAVALNAEVVATGIPGAGAITQIGKYHQGGPFNDNASFKATTAAGQILDSNRLFVASTSNFGAALAQPLDAPGSILSIDVRDGVTPVGSIPCLLMVGPLRGSIR